jgi:hypothetical protein
MGGCYIVHVDVDAAELEHQEVFERINPLYGQLVALVGFQEPGVVGGDELQRRRVGPQLGAVSIMVPGGA